MPLLRALAQLEKPNIIPLQPVTSRPISCRAMTHCSTSFAPSNLEYLCVAVDLLEPVRLAGCRYLAGKAVPAVNL